ncbi:hypothetical protein ABH931_000905 [Streptacidiphilus sp. MAP12-33]
MHDQTSCGGHHSDCHYVIGRGMRCTCPSGQLPETD